jgi:hypothetical protein
LPTAIFDFFRNTRCVSRLCTFAFGCYFAGFSDLLGKASIMQQPDRKSIPLASQRMFELPQAFVGVEWGLWAHLRALAVALHLYTDYVQAHQLSLFGPRGRAMSSCVSTCLIHPMYNGATTVYLLLVRG